MLEINSASDYSRILHILGIDALNNAIKGAKSSGMDIGQVSDGYHTFNELYEHRNRLWVALCLCLHDYSPYYVWRAKASIDGPVVGGWFLLGVYYPDKDGSQITYHLPMSMWDDCWFAKDVETAPIFDGHTSADILERLKVL